QVRLRPAGPPPPIDSRLSVEPGEERDRRQRLQMGLWAGGSVTAAVLVLLGLAFPARVKGTPGPPSPSPPANPPAKADAPPEARSDQERKAGEQAFQQGMTTLAKKDYALAISCFDEALRLGNRNAAVYARRGDANAARGDAQRAMEDYCAAL